MSKVQTPTADRPWFVYILRCGDGSFYTGVTTDLSRRLAEHNAGTASRYTRSRLPAVLIHFEPQPTRSSALKRELAIKALSRLEKERLIHQNGCEAKRSSA